MGVEERVNYKGRRIDVIREYSDTLLIVLFKMKGCFIEAFRHSGPGGGPIALSLEEAMLRGASAERSRESSDADV